MVERRVLSPWAAVLTVVVAFGASQIGSGIALVGLAFTLGLRDGLKLEELAREHVLQRYLATPLVVFAAIVVLALVAILLMREPEAPPATAAPKGCC